MAWIYKRADSKSWWIGWRAGGKQYLRSLKTEDAAEANRELSKVNAIHGLHAAGSLTAEVYASLTGATLVKRPLDACLTIWNQIVKETTSAGTAARYATVIKKFRAYTNTTATAPLIGDITADTVRGFLRATSTKTRPSTANFERKVITVFFHHALDAKWITQTPVDKSVKPMTLGDKTGRRPFTTLEIQLLHQKAKTPFWKYMVIAGYTTGQRMGDLITLRWENVDFASGWIHLRQQKTGKTVHCPMVNPLRSILLNQKPMKRGPIWTEEAARYIATNSSSFSNEFNALLAECGLVTAYADNPELKKGNDVKRATHGVSFHCLRHSFVTALKLSGAGQSISKELAGHSLDAVSDLYTHIPEATLKQAVDNLPAVIGNE